MRSRRLSADPNCYKILAGPKLADPDYPLTYFFWIRTFLVPIRLDLRIVKTWLTELKRASRLAHGPTALNWNNERWPTWATWAEPFQKLKKLLCHGLDQMKENIYVGLYCYVYYGNIGKMWRPFKQNLKIWCLVSSLQLVPRIGQLIYVWKVHIQSWRMSTD